MENVYVTSRLALITEFIRIRRHPIILGCFGFLVFVFIVVLFHRTSTINDKLSEIQENEDKIDFLIRASSAESCRELHQHGFTKNGYYQIDLDGRYRGLPSARIYCDFSDIDPKMIMFASTNGSIELNGSTNFTIDVTYDTNLEQMTNVIKNSNYCYQEIIFECQQMPLHTKDQNLAAWLDNQGNPRYFFDGSKSGNLNDRQCACGTFGGCQGKENVLCNCDFNYPYWTADQGKIEEKELLPITQFRYLGSSDNPGRAKLTIGNVICACPLEWNKVGTIDGCFRWLPQKVTLATAKTRCQALGGQVVAPRNMKQSRMLGEFAKSQEKTQFLIGIEKKDTKFVYSQSGQVVDFTSWDQGEPNNMNDAEDCVVIRQSGKWNDIDCNLPSFCLCKLN